MNTSFFKTIIKMFGFGDKETTKAPKGTYARPKQKAPKLGSINKQMKACREHKVGGRREARNIVKAVNKQDKKDARAYDRKKNPERYKLFSRNSRYNEPSLV